MKSSFVVTLDTPEQNGVQLDKARAEVARHTVQLLLTRYFESAGIHVTVTLQTGLPLHPFPTP